MSTRQQATRLAKDVSTRARHDVAGPVARFDRLQRRKRRIGIPVAILYKFFDDQGAYLAAVMTHYAFIAILPLMLIASSVLRRISPETGTPP